MAHKFYSVTQFYSQNNDLQGRKNLTLWSQTSSPSVICVDCFGVESITTSINIVFNTYGKWIAAVAKVVTTRVISGEKVDVSASHTYALTISEPP